MKSVGVTELKATLSAQLSCVKAGDEIVITERGRPIARIVRIEANDLCDHVMELARAGVVRLPRMNATTVTPRHRDEKARLLAALLDERREAR